MRIIDSEEGVTRPGEEEVYGLYALVCLKY